MTVDRFELPERVGVYRCPCGHTWPFSPSLEILGRGVIRTRGVRHPVTGEHLRDSNGNARAWHRCRCGREFRFVPTQRQEAGTK